MDMDDPLVVLALEHRRRHFDPACQCLGIERERQHRVIAQGMDGSAQCLPQRQRAFHVEARKGQFDSGAFGAFAGELCLGIGLG